MGRSANGMNNRGAQIDIGLAPPRRTVQDVSEPIALDLDTTVRNLYRAATAELPWEPVLDELCTGLGARALTLQPNAAADGRLLGLHQGGTALADSTLDYLRQWHNVDPQRSQALSAEHASAGGWLHSDAWLDEREALRQPYFRHFLPARGSLHSSHLAVHAGPSQITGLAIEWPRQRAARVGDELVLLERLGRHLRDALQAHERCGGRRRGARRPRAARRSAARALRCGRPQWV